MSQLSCAANASWATTPTAYNFADTDNQTRLWWGSQTRHDYFARQLAEAYGDQRTGLDCGINRQALCTIAGCKDFQQAGEPPWTYLATASVVNLGTYFNALYDGVLAGQVDYLSQIQQMAATFFPAGPSFPFGDALPWILAVLGTIFSLGALLAPPLQPIVAGIGAFASAGVQAAEMALEPQPEKESFSVVDMENFARAFGKSTRAMLSDWADSTFYGLPDKSNRTILDYIQGGAFVDPETIPSAKDIESFYEKQMVSRTINAQWRTKSVYILFTRTDNRSDDSGPNQTRYYSEEDKGVYYAYHFNEAGAIESGEREKDDEKVEGDSRTGAADLKPEGLDALNGSYFNISGTDITRASARSFRAGRFNFTPEMEVEWLSRAMASGDKLNPIEEGAGWIGTWTIPVCDTGTNNWNEQYGRYNSHFGFPLPCCCGPDCNDTKDFIMAANLEGSKILRHVCASQLAKTDIDFNKIDFGFVLDDSFETKWEFWTDGQRAGVVIGFLVAAVVAAGLLAISHLAYKTSRRLIDQGRVTLHTWSGRHKVELVLTPKISKKPSAEPRRYLELHFERNQLVNTARPSREPQTELGRDSRSSSATRDVDA